MELQEPNDTLDGNNRSESFQSSARRPTLDDRANWTRRFRQKFCTDKKFIKGYFLKRSEIEKLLQQKEELDGLKIYFGIDEQDQFRVVIVGADEKGNDYITPLTYQAKQTGEALLAETRPCPIHCGDKNVLNTD